MGTRQLHKLHVDQLGAASSNDESSESGSAASSPKPSNPFGMLLADDEDTQLGEESDTEAASPAAHSASTAHRVGTAPLRTQQQVPSKSKGKSGKQRRRAKAQACASISAARGPAQHDTSDVDAVLAELDLASGGTSTQTTSAHGAAPQQADVLATSRAQFDPQDELRGIFGTSVAALERELEQENQEEAIARGQRGGGTGGHAQRRRRGAPVRFSSANLMLAEHPQLPYDGSLDMELVAHGSSMPDGQQLCHFIYEPQSAYRAATAHYEQAQASYDPNNVMGVLQHFPFHVESLLAMVDLYNATDAADYASELLNRALFALESAWHPQFRGLAAKGAARLPVARGANALFFSAASRRVRSLILRGCTRTALEWARFTLSLDREDPVGMLFYIDYCALRCRQVNVVKQMMQRFHGSSDLHLLPSYSFSAALAEYYQLKESRGGAASATATGVHAAGDAPKLDAQLVGALLTFPTALVALTKTMQDGGAAGGAAWQSVLSRPLFAAPHGADSATLQHLCTIFAARHADLWKAPDALAWLLRCAERAADAAEHDGAQPAKTSVSPADACALVSVTYPPSEENEFAHLPAAQFSDARPTLPPEQIAALQGRGPPGGGGAAVGQGMQGGEDVEELQQLLAQLMHGPDGQGHRNAQGEVMTDEELRAANPVVALLRTLLPWVHLDDDAGDDAARPQAPQPRAVPRNLWDAAVGMAPELLEHLEQQGLPPLHGELSAQEEERIGQEIAAFMLRQT